MSGKSTRKRRDLRVQAEERRAPGASRYISVTLFLAFFIFTFIGAGNFIIVSLVGLFLCAMGFVQSSVRADLWILVPLILYNGISLLSGYRTYGNTLDGYASTQSVFPVIYLLSSYLGDPDRRVLKRLCAAWVGVMAAIGIGQFVLAAFSGTATRLSGLMGNPNAMGAMLALGWFALQSCLREENGPALERLLQGLEFITLAALALTLSVGAFGALGIGVLVMHFCGRERFSSLLCRLAEMIFAGGCGILLYIAGNATNWPWLCLILCGYILVGAWFRGPFRQELSDGKWAKRLLCLAGVFGAGAVVFLRPNAAATFAERLAMIRNGLGYLGADPLLGVGPYQWRRLNLQDADTYFNTWHIHNVFVHVGVELGLIAMAMLIIAVIRYFRKREDPAQRGAFSAALVHNLMDTSFFYMATVPFLIMTAGDGGGKKYRLSGAAAKCIFGVFAALFAWNMVQIFW